MEEGCNPRVYFSPLNWIAFSLWRLDYIGRFRSGRARGTESEGPRRNVNEAESCHLQSASLGPLLKEEWGAGSSHPDTLTGMSFCIRSTGASVLSPTDICRSSLSDDSLAADWVLIEGCPWHPTSGSVLGHGRDAPMASSVFKEFTVQPGNENPCKKDPRDNKKWQNKSPWYLVPPLLWVVLIIRAAPTPGRERGTHWHFVMNIEWMNGLRGKGKQTMSWGFRNGWDLYKNGI